MFRNLAFQSVSPNALQGTEQSLNSIVMTNTSLHNSTKFAWMNSPRIVLRDMDIEQITRKSFHRDLKELELRDLDWNYLDGEAFGGLENLKSLHISNCPLQHLGGVHNLRNLSLLNLYRVPMKMLHYEDLPADGALRRLYFQGSSLVYLFRNCTRENCQEIDPINAFANSSHYCSITTSRAKVVMFPNVYIINLNNNLIEIIPSNAFKCFPTLRLLNLKGNLITDLYKDSFLGLKALEKLYLDDNKIAYIWHGILLQLPKLKYMTIKSNMIKSIDFSSICPSSLHERLDSIQSAASLRDLTIGNNNITLTEKDAFHCRVSLRSLHLHGNGITLLKVGVFIYLTELSSLSIDENAITHIIKGTFDNLSKLTYLSLSNNEVSAIDDEVFQDLSRLSILHLNKNAISVLNTRTFAGLIKLERLYLDDNKISIIHSDAFQPLWNLKVLLLANNQIKSVYASAFSSLISLRFLNLADNNISTPTKEMFNVTRFIYLNNPLICTCDLYWIIDFIRSGFHETTCLNKPSFAILEYLDKFCCELGDGVCDPGISHHAVVASDFKLQMNIVIVKCMGSALLLLVASCTCFMFHRRWKRGLLCQINQPSH